MSLDILVPPAGVLTGAELQERLLASGWTQVDCPSPGFVRLRCPLHYEHDEARDNGPHHPVGSDGHRRVSWDPADLFSTWHAVMKVVELESWIKQPLCTPPLVFVPWIGVERALSYVHCATCGTRQEEGVTPVVRLSNKGSGGEWLCVPCSEMVGRMAASATAIMHPPAAVTTGILARCPAWMKSYALLPHEIAVFEQNPYGVSEYIFVLRNGALMSHVVFRHSQQDRARTYCATWKCTSADAWAEAARMAAARLAEEQP